MTRKTRINDDPAVWKAQMESRRIWSGRDERPTIRQGDTGRTPADLARTDREYHGRSTR